MQSMIFFVKHQSNSMLCAFQYFKFSIQPFSHKIERTDGDNKHTQQTQNICITFAQRRPNAFDNCYTNVLCLLGCLYSTAKPRNSSHIVLEQLVFFLLCRVIQMFFVYWILWKMDQSNASNLFAIPFSNNLPNKHQADPAIMLQHSWGSSKQIPPCVDGGLHPDPCSLWYADTVDLFSCNLQCVCWLEDARNLISDSFHWKINPTKNIFLIQFNSPYTQEYLHFNYSSVKHDLNRV